MRPVVLAMACKKKKFFDVALDLLKRHSGIVWDPGRFRGIAERRGREEVGEPCGRTRPKMLGGIYFLMLRWIY